MKKILTIFTVLLIVLSSGCTTKNEVNQEITHETNKYPTAWDDTEFYKTQEDVDADLALLKSWGDEFLKYQGKLNTVDGLLGYIETENSIEYNTIYDRIASYANFGASAFPSEQKYADAYNKLIDVMNYIFDAKSFIDSEMAAMTYEQRISLFTNEKIINYAPYFTEYLYDEVAVADDQLQQVYNDATLSHGNIRKIFDNFANFEIPEIQYTLKNGEKISVNNRNERSLLSIDDYDIEDKIKFNDAFWTNVSQYKNTLTSLLEQQLLEQYSNAKISGFNSTKDEALYNHYFKEDIIQKIIDFGHNSTDKLAEYYSTFADKDGHYYSFSINSPIGKYKPGLVNYDDAVDTVIAALNPLGEEYIEILKEEFNSGHIDVYPAENKRTGAFESGNYVSQYPYIMFNYYGSYSDVSAVAHELGHACYDILCNRNQSTMDWGASPFTHEVASLTNEIIYYQYMIDNSKTDEERMYNIQNLLASWSLNMYNSCYWQEFEQYCHELVESGQSLNADDLTNKWVELSQQYYGDGIVQGNGGQYRWLTLPNLYNNYYEFSYATAICYATVLAQNIINNVPGARDSFLAFLKTGNALNCEESLQIAGINIYDNAVYEQAFGYFEQKVDEFRNLAKK